MRLDGSPLWLLAMSIAACATGPTCPISPPQSSAPPVAPRIRRDHAEEANPPECRASADCPIGPHVDEAYCNEARRCAYSCEDHWGDCNNDMADGCETAIEHRRFCDGDPRIDAYDPPSVDFDMLNVDETPIIRGNMAFSTIFDRHVPWLEQCQKEALRTAPALEADIDYEVTIDDAGAVVSASFKSSSHPAHALVNCVECLLSEFDFEQAPDSFPRTFLLRLYFFPGGYSSRDPAQ